MLCVDELILKIRKSSCDFFTCRNIIDIQGLLFFFKNYDARLHANPLYS